MWAALAVSLASFTAAPTAAPLDQSVCAAPPAAAGSVVRGPILHVPGAGAVCVAGGPLPSQWVAVPLAVEAQTRSQLMAAAFGENATCTIGADGRGDCRIEGDALAARLDRVSAPASFAWR